MNPSQQKNLIGFSAIARSVMIFAVAKEASTLTYARFSAIARSVMIFAKNSLFAKMSEHVSVL